MVHGSPQSAYIVRAVNWVPPAWAAEAEGEISADDLLEQARQDTGLSDFGDFRFDEGLHATWTRLIGGEPQPAGDDHRPHRNCADVSNRLSNLLSSPRGTRSR